MANEDFKRKLTAILSVNFESYSLFMGDDEEATVRTLKSYRKVLTSLIQEYNGKLFDLPRYILLTEFVSFVNAVHYTFAVQKEVYARNEKLPEGRRV